MKRIFLLLLVASIGYAQTRTSNWALPQWGTGDTLKAGAKNTTPLSNYSLNNGFARIDAIAGAGIDSSGYFRHIRGSSGLNLNINADYPGGTVKRVVIQDSLYVDYNAQVVSNLLVGGNLNVGGYISTDSVVAPVVIVDSLVSDGQIYLPNGAQVGSAGTIDGSIVFESELNSKVTLTNTGVITSARTQTFKDADGELAIDGSDTTAFSGSNTRLAVYRAGVTPASKVVAVPRVVDAGNGSEALPVAGDLLKVMVKADSIIFLRAAGTTSGLKLTYTWLK